MTEENQASELGDFIRQQRQRANLSLRRLADHAGISNPYLSQIERGLRKPSASILKSLARALSISAETHYERAGLLEGRAPHDTESAISHDPVLTSRQKQAMTEIYRSFVRETTQEQT